MKITAIPQLYRNLKRWREILHVLRRYGLSDWLTHFRLPFRDTLKDRGGVPLSQYSREQRVRMALTDLGPTFIKLGQVLATRPDLVGPALGEELKRLRANVRPDDIRLVRSMLRSELGEDYQSHFQSIDPEPLATASIGQVHRAILNDGTRVVLKIQRVDIEKTMRQDMEVLTGLAQLAERVDLMSAWGPTDIVRQLSPMLTRELDFSRERQNLEIFAALFAGKKLDVVIPRPIKPLCTKRVLVMEELIGQPLAAFLKMEPGKQRIGISAHGAEQPIDRGKASADVSRKATEHPESTSPENSAVRPKPASVEPRPASVEPRPASVEPKPASVEPRPNPRSSIDAEFTQVGGDDPTPPSESSNDPASPSANESPSDPANQSARDPARPRSAGGDVVDLPPSRDQYDRIRSHLCETIAGAYLTMIFDEALFHADPHTGNLIVMKSGGLGILDFGMVGRIDENLRESIEEMLVAISSGDQHRLMRLIRRIGDTPPQLDESSLAIDVAEFIGTYGRQSLGDFDLTGALNELSDILHRHAIKLPNQSALLLKMLISLEGTLRELGASFDSLDVVRRFMRRSIARRFSPTRRLRQARRIYLEGENFLEVAPDEVISLLRQARRGEVRVRLEHQRLGPTVNRMVLGLMTSAVFLGSALMLAMKVPPLLFPQQTFMSMKDISVLGLLGVIGSITVMMWLLLAINRSGHLTRGNED